MAQESPTGVDLLDAYRKWTAERKGRSSIDMLPTTKGSDARAEKGSVGPSHKSKKSSREGGNTTTTTRSPSSLPTPPPRRDTVEVDSPSPKCATMAAGPTESKRTVEVSMSSLTLLGGDMQFT